MPRVSSEKRKPPAKRESPAKRKSPGKPKTNTKARGDSASEQFAVLQSVSELLDVIEEEEAEDARERGLERLPRKPATKADRNLVAAAYYGGIDDAKKALAAGASPDARNDDKQTALYRAVAGEQCAMVEFLLKNGADPDATVIASLRAGLGREVVEITPLTRAQDERLRKIAGVLKRHGGRYVRNPV